MGTIKKQKMKSLYTIVLIICFSSILSSKRMFQVGDIPNCMDDLQKDFTDMETAIQNKDWNSVGEFLKNVTKTYLDCKDAYNQAGLCMNDLKGVISNIFDLFSAVKDRDMNPVHYWNYVRGIYDGMKTFNNDCFEPRTTYFVRGIVPQDLTKCKDDLANEFNDVIKAIENKDLSQFDDFFTQFSSTFTQCQAAYNEVAGCATPVVDTIQQIVTVIKNAT